MTEDTAQADTLALAMLMRAFETAVREVVGAPVDEGRLSALEAYVLADVEDLRTDALTAAAVAMGRSQGRQMILAVIARLRAEVPPRAAPSH